jgi:hypothetical protein
MDNKEKLSYILDVENNIKFYFVDNISEYEIDPLTDGGENLLLYDATCFQDGVIYLDEYTKGPWILVDKNEFYHVFEANNLDHENFNGLNAKLYFLNEDIEQEAWYEDYVFEEGEIKVGEEFSTAPMRYHGMYLFSSSPNTYKRFYENE